MAEKSEEKWKFDDILKKLGEYGRFQKILSVAPCLLVFPVNLQIAILVFATGTPGFHCTSTQQLGNQSNATVCKANTCCANCTQYSFDGPYTSSVNEWNLICDRAYLAAVSQSLFMVGMLLGSIVFGSMSDWFGRRTTMYITSGLTVIFGLGSSFVDCLSFFIFLRFAVGASCTGLMLSAYVYFMEIVGPSKRTFAAKFQDFFWAGSGMSVVLLGYLVRDWRTSLIIVAIPGVFFFLFWRKFPESARWLVAQGRLDEAQAVLTDYDVSKRVDSRELRSMLAKVTATNTVGENRDEGRRATIMDLVRGPRIRKRSLICCFNWFVISLGYYVLLINITNLSGDLYFNFFINYLLEVPASPISWFLLQRFGRRIPYCSFLCMGGIVCLLVLAVPQTEANGMIITGLAMIGKFAIQITFSNVYLFTSELYPTVVRNMAIGVFSMSARVGSIVAPYIVLAGQLRDNDVTLPMIIIGALCLAGGALAFLLPETLNKNLPQTLEEVEIASDEPHTLVCCSSRQNYKPPDAHAQYISGKADVNLSLDKDNVDGDNHVTKRQV